MRRTTPPDRPLRAWSRVRGLSALALAAVVAAVLGACAGEAGDDVPSPTATATASATASPSPTPTPAPSRPAAMARGDVEGAEAAARYFLSLYPYAYSTGDLEEWIALSDPECVFCASVVERVTELHENGGYETGGELTFESVTGSEPIPGNEYFGVDLVVVQGEGKKYPGEGLEPEAFGDLRAQANLAIEWRTPSGWIVREATLEEIQ